MAVTMHFNYWYMAKFCVVWIAENLNHMIMDNF